ncbi:adenylyltransferase/cytidyltransferase family protein [Candidatus Woesebacteria bacterium]|nr:adenylyltransferase/cytidyltransferase family protein [Candidatus Woesebacteria bacterium]
MQPNVVSGSKILNGECTLPVDTTATVVLVGGCFDVIHYGHLMYLKNAKAQGDVLVVALENDQFIRTHKGRAPFHTQKQRAEMLLNLKSVDFVILLPTMKSDDQYRKLVTRIKPAIIAVTAGDAQADKKKNHAKAVKAKFSTVNSIIKGLSSSTITTYARILHD